jgi:hypothetical protein
VHQQVQSCNIVHVRQAPSRSQRRATRLIFLLCGIAQSAWVPLVRTPRPAFTRTMSNSVCCFCALEQARSSPCQPWEGLLVVMAVNGLFKLPRGLFCGARSRFYGAFAKRLSRYRFSVRSFDRRDRGCDEYPALLVERGSGENLMLGFHGHFSVGGFARALLLSLEFCLKAHFGLFLLQCSLLCAKRAYYSFKLISVRAFTRLAIGPIARLTKPPNDQDRS